MLSRYVFALLLLGACTTNVIVSPTGWLDGECSATQAKISGNWGYDRDAGVSGTWSAEKVVAPHLHAC